MSRFFPDINVLIALSLPAHLHYTAATQWHASAGKPVLQICRMTQLGLLRLLTTESVAGVAVLNNNDAFAFVQRLFDDRYAEFSHEPNNLDALIAQFAVANQPSPKLWTDAYLSAFSVALGLQLVTFDAALARRTPHSVLLRP